MDSETRTLIARAQAEDGGAIEELFRRYRDRLRAALRRMLGERYRRTVGDSEDAVQDAILAALRRLRDFEYRGEGSFLAWLLQGAEFEVRRKLRMMAASKRQGGSAGAPAAGLPVEAASREATPSEVAAGREIEERVAAALERLPPREREVIMLRRYLGLGAEEICVELDLPSAGAARALLSRAQARLAECLSEGA